MGLRVAIVADTHGWIDPRIADLVADCDLAVHGGDIGNACVLARMQPRSGRVYAVRGNNDVGRKWPIEDRPLLARIPDQAVVDLPGGKLVVVHGHRTSARGRHARLRRNHPDARAVVYGHSHRLLEDRQHEPWILNPGAAGRSRTFGGPSCIILTATEHAWELSLHRFELSHGRRRREPSRHEAAA
jgi:putative phosphoesterase